MRPDSSTPTALSEPLLIATNAPESAFSRIVLDAVVSIPEMPLSRRVKAGFRPASAVFSREAFVSSPAEDKLWRRVDLTDSAKESQHRDKNCTHWMCDVSLVAPDEPDGFGTGFSAVVRLDVIRIALKDGFIAAPQLALLRHLVWRSYRRLDPDSRAQGFHDWHPAFWPDVPIAS